MSAISEYIWFDGKIIHQDEVNLSLLTHSLHYAGSAWEGERSYNGVIFKLMEHTTRLLESAKAMHLEVAYSADEIAKATKEVIIKNNLSNSYIRPIIWRSSESMMVYNKNLTTHIAIIAFESNAILRNDIRLCVSPWRKPSVNVLPPQSKCSAAYAMLTISKKIAHDERFDDALILDQYEQIAECTTTNIFFIKDDVIFTPIADRFLNGITRQTVIEIARNIGKKVYEVRLTLDEIANYQSCFLTGTSAEIQGVTSINFQGKKVNFTISDLILTLQDEYAKIVGKIN